MRKLVLVAHISLDGFVAGRNGELDGFDASEENLQFVANLADDADAALFGRTSYELLNNYWPAASGRPDASKGTIAYSNWYNSAQKIVISRTLVNEHLNKTTIISDDIPNKIIGLKKQQGRDILIFGSPSVAQLLMQAGLVDSYWIFINPVIFGKGIPLFSGSTDRVKLKLQATRQFPNGEIALHYIAGQ
jgi:dihydrofolate reductase